MAERIRGYAALDGRAHFPVNALAPATGVFWGTGQSGNATYLCANSLTGTDI